ncbi:dehydrogenase [Paenibacillus lentus]|uniref:Dehydrogenase n=1 Tax=Paenibacillus lentus TaxID=1338368 RepID=A0A3Q8SEF3_9BACL|nr:dehydrogenase [Paenibacillus lentus]
MAIGPYCPHRLCFEITNLHTELSPKDIFVAHRSLGAAIKAAGIGTLNDPNVIADMWYQAYAEKRIWEEEYPNGVPPETIVL